MAAASHHMCLQAEVPQTAAAEAAAAEAAGAEAARAEAAATKQATEARQLETEADAPLDPYYQQVRSKCSPNAASACRARNCHKAIQKNPMRSTAIYSTFLLQALNRPQSRAETDAFNKMHFQQLRLARQHSHRPTAVTPKVVCSACTLQLPCSQLPMAPAEGKLWLLH